MCIETKYLHLKHHSIFSDLEETRLMEIVVFAKVHTIYRGETISYGDGDYSKIYFVIKGKIKLAEANDLGEELIKDILTEGDILGDISLDGNPSIDEYAEALTANTIICGFNIVDFKKILQSNPLLALRYANKVSSKLKRAENRHADLVFRDAKSRLIRFIKYWANIDGSRIGDKIVLNNYLTHSDIAGFISTSRQSVNVLLNELRDSGMLFYNRKKIELNNSFQWN
jgi:CRP/FNR family transcriptional regulator